MVKLHHIHLANRDRLLERFTRPAVAQQAFAGFPVVPGAGDRDITHRLCDEVGLAILVAATEFLGCGVVCSPRRPSCSSSSFRSTSASAFTISSNPSPFCSTSISSSISEET